MVIICLSVIIVIAGIINFNTIRTTEYKISIPKKSSVVSNIRVAFVSDFHLQESTGIRFVEKFIKKISFLKPDLMLYGGDIVEGDSSGEKMAIFEDLLGNIKTRYGVYGVPGNHEHYGRQDKGDFFTKAGIHLLRDSMVIINNSFAIIGRNDSHSITRESAEEIIKAAPDSLPVIVLDHRPTEISQISRTSADVVFSGHTHDGQLFPINFITRSIYELRYGHMKKGETHFFVSCGIRLWGPPVRTTGKSEIVIVDITLTGK